MLLKDKVAVVYGAGGPIGGAIARRFTAAGALVQLAGRTEAKLRAVAEEIGASAGRPRTAVVDARRCRHCWQIRAARRTGPGRPRRSDRPR
jgi:3-oxoacyl-[acyl-carrier protein] reductase